MGDNIGYQIGKMLGPRLFKKDSLIFRHDYIMKAEQFYEKYGSKTMLISHFFPVVRSFAPVTAGAGNMDRKKFIVYGAVGIIAWTLVVTLTGYYIGSRIPGIERLIEPILLGIIIIFLLPTLYHVFKDRRVRAVFSPKFLRRKDKSKSTKD